MGWWSKLFDENVETYAGEVVKPKVEKPTYVGLPINTVEEMLHPVLAKMRKIERYHRLLEEDEEPQNNALSYHEDYNYSGRERGVYFMIGYKPVKGVTDEFVRYWVDQIRLKQWSDTQTAEDAENIFRVKQFVKNYDSCKES